VQNIDEINKELEAEVRASRMAHLFSVSVAVDGQGSRSMVVNTEKIVHMPEEMKIAFSGAKNLPNAGSSG
jgi:hypothetical protein